MTPAVPVGWLGWLAAGALVLPACSTEEPAAAPPGADAGESCEPWRLPDGDVPCSGGTSLCSRCFSDVAFATAHNAMSNADAGWIAPNHYHGIAQQLRDGVRALMIDTHYDGDGLPALCHGSCAFGSRPLTEALSELERFMSCNPELILTLIIESYVSGEDTEAAFEHSGLAAYAHTQVPAAPWPSLQEMIDDGRRLVVLSDDGGSAPWLHPVWDHAWETPFSVADPTEFTCEHNRGSPDNPLFILNHFITNPTADVKWAQAVNPNPFFIERALACQTEAVQLPNFLTVDFYSIGDVLAVAAALNEP